LKVFVGGTTPYADNRGNAAIFSGIIALLNQFKGYTFKINVWHSYPESLRRHIKSAATTCSVLQNDDSNVDVNIIYHKLPRTPHQAYIMYSIKLLFSIVCITLLRLLRVVHFRPIPRIKIVQELLSSDFIIELNFGDTFTDTHYGKIIWFFNVLRMTLELFSRKPFYLFPQSIGPFKSIFSRAIARIILKDTKLVAVRESYSLKNVILLGVNENKVHFIPDMSFWSPIISNTDATKLLKNANIDKNDSSRKLVGLMLSVNFLTKRKTAMPLQTVANTIDRLIDELGVDVILVPHGTALDNFSFDSRALSIRTQKMLKNRDHAVVLTNEYTVEELWGIIGMCDIVISTLTHPVMSSLRQGVPVIALSYSHKTQGIMQLFQMEKYLLKYDDFSDTALVEITKEMLNDFSEIKQHLTSHLSFINEYMTGFQQMLHGLLSQLKA